MVEDRDIRRYDIPISYHNRQITLRLSVVRLWDDSNDEFSRYNIHLKIPNSSVNGLIDDKKLDGGKWTVIAHSDHNPNGGHNIRDLGDSKQLHIDIHPYNKDLKEYNVCHAKLCDGHPPKSNEKAISLVKNYMRQNTKIILMDYLDFHMN